MIDNLFNLFNSKNIGSVFEERIEKIGFTNEKIFNIAASLQNSNLISDGDKETLGKIFASAPRLDGLHALSNNEIYFLNSIFERAIGVNVLGINNTSNLLDLLVLIRRIIFTVFGLISIFILCMALYEGHSNIEYFKANGIVSVGVIFTLLCVLFLLEGTQISLTSLRLKDIDLIEGVRSPVRNLHAEYRSEQNIQKYLAGRQLLTIVTVFVISRICSFTDLNVIPGLNSQIPDFMNPWFKTLFYDYGILAALVTLWLGQLAPQFWANKQPLKFLSLPLTRLTVKTSRILEAVGITDFGGVITSNIKTSSPIPISSRERYDTFRVINGYSATGISVRYTVKENTIDVDVIEDFLFDRNGITKIHLEEELQGGVTKKSTHFELYRDGSIIESDVASNDGVKNGDSEIISYVLTPRQASFLEGDSVIKKLNFTFDRDKFNSRRMTITRPIRYLLITIEAEKLIELGQPRLQLIDENRSSSSKDFSELFNLERVHSSDDKSVFAYFHAFPNTEIIYDFSWEKEK